MGADEFVITQANLAHVDGVHEGWLAVSGGHIADIGTGEPPPGERVDVAGCLVVPGFVDTHCHGGGGGSFSSADPDELARAIAAHRRHGTTTQLASLVSDPVRALTNQVSALTELVTDGELAGIHLEGPFLARARCGAHDPTVLREPDDSTVDTLLAAGKGSLRMVTLAPELAGGVRAVGRFVEAGVLAAIGHTDAHTAQVTPAVEAGASVATHLFNGMPQLHHREPGPVGALLDDERVTVELICDLVHAHPMTVHLASRHAGRARTTLITDAMSATDAADGRYRLGTLEVDVRGGVATLAEQGSLAGSTLTMDAAFRNFVLGAGMEVTDAVWASATRPAELLGLGARTGSLRPGLEADLVVLDDRLHPARVLRKGKWVHDVG